MTDQQPSWRDLYLPRKTDLFILVRHSEITVDEATAAIGPLRALTRRHKLECIGGVAFGTLCGGILTTVMVLSQQPALAAAMTIWTLGTIVLTAWWCLSRPSRSKNTPDLLLIDRTTRSVLSSLVAHIDEGDIVHEIWTIRGWLRGVQSTPLQQLQIVHERHGEFFRTAVLTDYPVHKRARRLAEALGARRRDYKLSFTRSPKFKDWDEFVKLKQA